MPDKLEDQSANLTKTFISLQKELREKLDVFSSEKAANGKVSAALEAKMNDLGDKLLGISEEQNRLKKLMADAEVSEGKAPSRVLSASPGSAFVKSKSFDYWKENEGVGAKTCAPVSVAFGQKAFGDDAYLASGDNIGALMETYRDPEVIRTQRRAGYQFRQVMRQRMVPEGANSVEVKQETARYEAVVLLTSAISASASAGVRTLNVNTLAGFTASAPYNKITMDNGAGTTEEFTITAVTPTSILDPNGPGAFACASTANILAYAVGDRGFTLRFSPSLEAHLSPIAVSVYETRTIPIEDLRQSVEHSANALTDGVFTQQIIDEDLEEAIGREEDRILLYGSGTTGKVAGLFIDSRIPSFDWSASDTGTDRVGFIIDLIFQSGDAEYMASDVYLSNQDYKKIIKTKNSTGDYLFWSAMNDQGISVVLGVRLHRNTALTTGDCIAGDFSKASFWLKKDATIRIAEINDQASRGMLSVIGHERFGMNVDHPLAFTIGKFDSAPG